MEGILIKSENEIKLEIKHSLILKPHYHFYIASKTNKYNPFIINIVNLDMKSHTYVRLSDNDVKRFVKEMNKHKTDVFISNEGKYYTRCGNGIVEIWNQVLEKYTVLIAGDDIDDNIYFSNGKFIKKPL